MYKYIQIIGFISLVLSCNQSKQLVNSNGENISISKAITPDKTIETFIGPYKQNLDKSMNEVLSYAVDTYSKRDGDYNTAIGNLMADAVFELSNPIFKNRSGNDLDLVLLNHGGIRSVLPKGNVTTKSAYSLMPFENSVVVVPLKGSVLMEMTK